MEIRSYLKKGLQVLTLFTCAALVLLVSSPAKSQEALRGEEALRKGKLFYVSLGDSLAVGAQQDPKTGVVSNTKNGYPNQLHTLLKTQYRNLELVKLGCGGERAETMINGGVCNNYRSGNQLTDTLNFIRDHRDKILLLTINIGANDIAFSGCLEITDPAQQFACFQNTFQILAANLSTIHEKLARVSKGKFPIIGLNTPNFYLHTWLFGEQGQAMAFATSQLHQALLAQVYTPIFEAYSVVVADIATAFHSFDFSTLVETTFPPPNDLLPLNVATICELTYGCPPPGSNLPPDAHFTTEGYGVTADVLLEAFESTR